MIKLEFETIEEFNAFILSIRGYTLNPTWGFVDGVHGSGFGMSGNTTADESTDYPVTSATEPSPYPRETKTSDVVINE